MIAALVSFPAQADIEALHSRFLEILPTIERHARIAFRNIRCPDRREDRVADAVSICWKWFLRLEERGKDVGQFVTTFGALAARAVRCGRRLCGQEKAQDAMSGVAQQRHSFVVGKLPDHSTLMETPLAEALIDNNRTEVPEQVCFRIDFPAWLSNLSDRDRRVIVDMAMGERTIHLARKYGISEGRISQLRRQFHDGWERFCEEYLCNEPATAACC